MTDSQYDEIRGAIRTLRGEVLRVNERLDEIGREQHFEAQDRSSKHAAIMGHLQTIRAQTKTMGIDPLPLHLTEEQAVASLKSLSWRDADGNPVEGPCADRIALAESKAFAERVTSGKGEDRTGLSNAEAL